jgi:ATP phosphoribosyltransferase
MADPLVLCLPSKGSLSDGVTRLFEQCLIPVKRIRGARSYEASIGGFDDVHVLLARATEIPSMLDAQQVHVGITGLDLVREHVGEGASPIHIVMPDLGFGRADLVVGVPRTWLDVVTVADLVEVSDDVRHRHQRPIRVATKFPNLTREFFRTHGLTDYRIVESLGAIEAAPRAGQADVIVDLTSTGTTLEANGLKQIAAGTVLRSQASLVGSGHAGMWSSDQLATLGRLVMLFEASLAAQRQRVVRARFGAPGPADRAVFDPLLVEATWTEGGGLVELVGRAEVGQVPGLLAALLAAGSVASSVEEPGLLVSAGSQALDRFRTHLGV